MENIKEYKCPCCGGAVVFDSSVQKMKCPFCDTEFEIDAMQDYEEELDNEQKSDMKWDMPAGGEWSENEESALHTYVCKSCGGEIVGDESLAASLCPFCGNPIVIAGQLSGELRPDYVLPFKLDKKAAKEGLMKHISGKRLLPKIFKDQNHIDEIKGIYVPFWLFDTDAEADIRYKATTIRKWSDSNYNYTETSYFTVRRCGNIDFEHVPVDGSNKLPDELMESIEPFDFSEAVPFKTAYLAGYMADKYDISAENSIERANERVKCSTEDAFSSTVKGYVSVVPENSNIKLNKGCIKYALYPVWLLNTTWNGNKYTFAMNGQTGKFVGDLPADKSIAVKWTVGLSVLFTLLSYIVIYILWITRVI